MIQKQSDIHTIYLEDYPDLKPVGHTSTNHIIYKCPVCEKLKGTPDTKGKLYFNTIKRVGMCFRCGTRLRSGRTMNKEELLEYKEYMDSLKDNKEPANLDLSYYDKIEIGSDPYNYLISRKLDIGIIRKFDIRSCEIPLKGVVFNNPIDGETTDFFQIRDYITTDHSKRFFNPSNIIKPLVYLGLAERSMILCEGFMSGLTAYKYLHEMGTDYSPIVSMGKSLSTYQLKQLKSHCEKYNEVTIVVCYDGGFNREAVKASEDILKEIPNCKVFILRLPNDKDPNDLTYDEFVSCWTTKLYKVTGNCNNILFNVLKGK